MVTPAEIVAAARARVGTRYQHQAAVDGVACDCIGLVALVAAQVGVQAASLWERDAQRRSYAATPDPAALLGAAAQYLERVQQAEIGDVLLFRIRNNPAHFAINAGDTMIHAWSPAGRVVENHIDKNWRRRLVAAYRFR